MKKIMVLLFFIMANVQASNTPLSGVFSNATSNYQGYMDSTMNIKVNLIVILNESGQQFFIQCFNESSLGFGVTTEFEIPQVNVTIKAGQNCPANLLSVQLDYNNATLRFGSERIHLMRGKIYVPISE